MIRPTHTLARRRVVTHARQAFADWEARHVQADRIDATPADLRALQATLASYRGHLRHAATHRLQNTLLKRFRWLPTATRPRRFHHQMEGRRMSLRFRGSK